MRFSLTPQPGESGFTQWLDAMKMVARLQGGIPPEFRKRVSKRIRPKVSVKMIIEKNVPRLPTRKLPLIVTERYAMSITA